jgi:uncharacterized protein (TIGR02268 family)
MNRYLLLLALVSATAAGAAGKNSREPAIEPLADEPQRAPKKRVIVINDENADQIPELHVAPAVPTILVFKQKVSRAVLADSQKLMYPPNALNDEVILAARKELPAKTLLPLTITLADGTILTFQLKTLREVVDLQVEIEVAIAKNAAADSPQALRSFNAQLRAQLDECKASTGSAGTEQIASHILEQDEASAPSVRTFEGHAVHSLDRQQSLLVEATYLYRLFGLSYLVLVVENRDATKPWVLDRPELKLAGGATTSDIAVKNFRQDINGGLPPGEKEKLVVAFETPAQTSGQKISVRLLEKGGGRHVTLDVAP